MAALPVDEFASFVAMIAGQSWSRAHLTAFPVATDCVQRRLHEKTLQRDRNTMRPASWWRRQSAPLTHMPSMKTYDLAWMHRVSAALFAVSAVLAS